MRYLHLLEFVFIADDRLLLLLPQQLYFDKSLLLHAKVVDAFVEHPRVLAYSHLCASWRACVTVDAT